MKRLLCLFIALLSALNAFAQIEVKENSVKEVAGFINLNENPDYQYDDNDKPFATTRVM